jgi:protein disulfide-isomerase A6
MRLPSILLPLVTLALSVTASKVVDLDGDNFDKLVGAGKPALVEFFAPWVSVRFYVGLRSLYVVTG